MQINPMDAAAGAEISPDKMAAMRSRLGVVADFVRVPQLAAALGISSTSIHAQMRRGNFPIAHRRVGNVIVVKLEDYVRWFDGTAGEPAPVKAAPIARPSCAPPRSGAELAPPIQATAVRETRADFKARLQRQVTEGMRRKGFDI
jgi:predicted DNA-binding transcriptional regulator AlpA